VLKHTVLLVNGVYEATKYVISINKKVTNYYTGFFNFRLCII
jgi:hypothetical protein